MGIRDPGVDLQGVAPTSYKMGLQPLQYRVINPMVNMFKAIYKGLHKSI